MIVIPFTVEAQRRVAALLRLDRIPWTWELYDHVAHNGITLRGKHIYAVPGGPTEFNPGPGSVITCCYFDGIGLRMSFNYILPR